MAKTTKLPRITKKKTPSARKFLDKNRPKKLGKGGPLLPGLGFKKKVTKKKKSKK